MGKISKVKSKNIRKNKLTWRQKWNDDKSGYWYSAKIPIIGWEYIIDVYETPEEFTPSIFYSNHDSDTTPIINKTYKTKEGAMNACEKHFENFILKLKAYLNS